MGLSSLVGGAKRIDYDHEKQTRDLDFSSCSSLEHFGFVCRVPTNSTAVASNRRTEALASVIYFTFVVYSHYKHS